MSARGPIQDFPAGEKVNILMVDDRPENLISLAAVLDSPGYNLVKAESGRDALRHLLDGEFALILLDVQMPLLDGIETATLIKKRERSKNIPIIFVTAISRDEPFMFRGYGAGAVDYITKPFDPDMLRSKVAVFAELHRKSRMLLRQAQALHEREQLEHEQERFALEVQALRREQIANRRFLDLVRGINHGVVWASDIEAKRISFVSPSAEKLTGYPANDWTEHAHFWRDRLHPEDVKPVMDAISTLNDERPETDVEHRFIRADGTVVWFQTGLRLTEANGPGTQELRALSVDVTRLKNAEEAAQAAIRVRDEFLSIASHELKTPLTPLKLQLQALRRTRGQPTESTPQLDRVARSLETCDRQVDRLSRLVDELLDVARMSNGKLVLQVEEVDVGELIPEVTLRYQTELTNAACELNLVLDETVVSHCDRMRIEQVIINLLTNAIRYAAGKPIELGAGVMGDRARLWVKDRGRGISAEDQRRIFQRFEWASPSSAFGGLGLGLYIVSQILDAHRGQITVKSTEGEGATFFVELPLRALPVSVESPGEFIPKPAPPSAASFANPA